MVGCGEVRSPPRPGPPRDYPVSRGGFPASNLCAALYSRNLRLISGYISHIVVRHSSDSAFIPSWKNVWKDAARLRNSSLNSELVTSTDLSYFYCLNRSSPSWRLATTPAWLMSLSMAGSTWILRPDDFS